MGNPSQDLRGIRIRMVCHALELDWIDGVQADRDAVETRLGQSLGLLLEQEAVGGQRQLNGLTFKRSKGGELCDERLEVFSQEGLASREANLLNAKLDKSGGDSNDLVEAQHLLA
jgi:hypothetical protein